MSRLAGLCLAAWSVIAHAAAPLPAPTPGALEIKFSTARAGTVLLNIYRADGTLVRRLEPGKSYPKGAHKLVWDGLTDDGKTAEPGDYTWKGLFHEGIGLKLRGWVGSGGGTPWVTPDGKGGWGGDRGVPSAVAADDQKVYLGWSLAENGKSVLACDLDGHVQWGHRRSEGASGCKALAVDDGLVYVLGGLEHEGAEGGSIYRLNVNDGAPVPWPNGAIDLKISSLWPADGKTKPDVADAMAVRHGHIYLSFTSSQFLTILDAKSGAYLQTVVGAPPGMIDVAPTKTELPDAPGKLSDADFAVISLGGGVLGRILFAHDPFWVITSDMARTEREETITALTVIGDGAKFHPRTAFVGFGAPHHQVQARPLLDTENPTWVAGLEGGRPLLGPWKADAFHAIRGLALAADGRLWVAEADATPKRFSVWDTTGKEGKLVREFFGPAESGSPGAAINPLDPDVMFAQGCEWRIDRKTGVAKCLGVVTREPVYKAQYGVGKNGHAYLVTQSETHPIDIFERVGDGDYKLRTRVYGTDDSGSEKQGPDATKIAVWAEGQIQPGEPRSPSFLFISATPGLALQCVSEAGDHPENSGFYGVEGWISPGAPRYDLSRSHRLPDWSRQVSPDVRLALCQNPGFPLQIWCREVGGQEKLRWAFSFEPEPKKLPVVIGSALLPLPIKNAWVVASEGNGWNILTEDGFNLAQLFEHDAQKVMWPEFPAPGADMTHAAAPSCGSIAQTRAGKLYVEAAGSAFWNLEVTGLEKVKALSGGKVTMPAAK
ncbi:MAG: FlgD immunoglobulin-like domain containing protein [Chthoniobacter sp.]|uniref:FlgD immunoglobulin-like domain containing protein n=1 Tax=Chthoniobacter sp. TaxID=2510640 RepID=UPI0032AC2F6C